MKREENIKSYENLANAIIENAVDDIRYARQNPYGEASRSMKNKACSFLRSKWASELTSLDCEMLLAVILKEKVLEPNQKRRRGSK